MSTPNPLDVRNLGALLGMLGNYQQGNYGFGPETNFAFPLLGGYGVNNGGASAVPPPPSNAGGAQGGIPPGMSPGTNFPGGPIGIPQGGGTGGPVGGSPITVTPPGQVVTTPGDPGTPSSGGIDFGEVGQAAGLGMGLFGALGAAAGALPIITADPYTPGTPAGAPTESLISGPAPIGGDYLAGAAPGSMLNMGGATPGVADSTVTTLSQNGALTSEGVDVATNSVNEVLAQLPPEIAAQVVMAIQSGTDPVDAMRGVAIMGNAPGGWTSMQGNYGTYTDPETGQTYTVPMASVDALDAIGQSNLTDMGNHLAAQGWYDHLGIGNSARNPRAR